MQRLAGPLTTESDLDPLLQRIGDAPFVLLGEAAHGTHEIYRVAAAQCGDARAVAVAYCARSMTGASASEATSVRISPPATWTRLIACLVRRRSTRRAVLVPQPAQVPACDERAIDQ